MLEIRETRNPKRETRNAKLPELSRLFRFDALDVQMDLDLVADD